MDAEYINPDAELHIRGLDHATLPVRDRYRAARFYIAVLGAEAHHESDPDRVKKGLARALQVGVRVSPRLEFDLFEQDYGQPAFEQSHPHHAFDVPPETLVTWAAHLKKWGVPHAGPMTRKGTGSAEIYFTDPDGNPLELHCVKYPGHENLPAGPYDKKITVHETPWPPAELADEADRLMEASLERMRARKRGG
jgi:catechol-2,3-dioxygenase